MKKIFTLLLLMISHIVSPAIMAQEVLSLDTPDLQAQPVQNTSLGPFDNLNFGGALDMRVYFPRSGGPTDQHIGQAYFDIHVSELFLSTNVGDHISILAEQLLVTSPMGSTIGQDHGFVYAIFSNLSFLPSSWAIKMGRFRYRYGIDSKLDSPANTLKTPVYQNLGNITDKGIELSGYSGPVEWSLGVMNGVDMISGEVTGLNGETFEVEKDYRNGSKPIVARVSWDVSDNIAVGLSAFSGKSYPVYSHFGFSMHDMIFNGHTDTEMMVYKNRQALDMKFKLGSRFDLSAEYSRGHDRMDGQNILVWSGFGRLDYRIIPQKFTVQVQYTMFDDGRQMGMHSDIDDDSANVGLGLTYNTTDQTWIRLSYIVDDRAWMSEMMDSKAESLATLQTFLSF